MAVKPVSGSTPAMPVKKTAMESNVDKGMSKTVMPSVPTPPVSKPTATMGNKVNTYA